jgi:hypothetical protein
MTEHYDELGGQPSPIALPETVRGCGRDWCNHIDGHVCPWMDWTTATGKAVPCGCSHKPATPIKKKGK